MGRVAIVRVLPLGSERDNGAAARAGVDREERVPGDRTESTRCDHELVGAPRPGVAADLLHVAVMVDRVHPATGRFRAARSPGRREQPVAEAPETVECQRAVRRRRVRGGKGREHGHLRAVPADLIDLVVRRVAEDRSRPETLPAGREDAAGLLHESWHRREPLKRPSRRRRGPDRVLSVLDVEELPASPDKAVQLLPRLCDHPEPQRRPRRTVDGRAGDGRRLSRTRRGATASGDSDHGQGDRPRQRARSTDSPHALPTAGTRLRS